MSEPKNPVFRHADDEKWQEVRALELPTGRASVWEKWLAFTPRFLSLYARWNELNPPRASKQLLLFGDN